MVCEDISRWRLIGQTKPFRLILVSVSMIAIDRKRHTNDNAFKIILILRVQTAGGT